MMLCLIRHNNIGIIYMYVICINALYIYLFFSVHFVDDINGKLQYFHSFLFIHVWDAITCVYLQYAGGDNQWWHFTVFAEI